MLKLKRFTVIISLIFLFALLFTTCGPTVVVRKPPPPRTEVRSSKPYANAVWVSGHWKWSGGRYVWVPGYWAKPRPGEKWVSGHWVKRPRGWVYVKGHWR